MKEIDKYLNAHRLRMPNIAADRDNPIWYRIPGDFGARNMERDKESECEIKKRKMYCDLFSRNVCPV